MDNVPENQNDFQYTSSHGVDAQLGAVGVGRGDYSMPFGQSNTPIDMSTYDNVPMNEMSRLIPDPSVLPGHQSHQQQHPYTDMSSLNHPQAGLDFSIPPTPPSMVPNPKAPSDDSEWEDFLCLGITCPRKGLEAFKMAVLEAAT